MSKIAIITGGGGLLAYEHSRALIEKKFKIILLDKNNTNLQKNKRKLNTFTNFCYSYEIDITDELSVKNIFSQIKNKFRIIDVLINNAAINPVPKNYKNSNSYHAFLKEDFEVSIIGALNCVKYTTPLMNKYNGGVIVNIGSDLSIIAPDQRIYKHLNFQKPIFYSINKHGIVGMTKYLAVTLAKKNIRVNCLSPGGVFDNQDSQFIKNLKKLIPLNRMAKKNEYREAIKFLCSDKNAYMTGQNLVIDGGRTII